LSTPKPENFLVQVIGSFDAPGKLVRFVRTLPPHLGDRYACRTESLYSAILIIERHYRLEPISPNVPQDFQIRDVLSGLAAEAFALARSFDPAQMRIVQSGKDKEGLLGRAAEHSPTLSG
jgi:hypothetical protein